MKSEWTITAALLLVLAAAGPVFAQGGSASRTVRHHAEESPDSALLVRAEAAMDKKDYTTAEPLLRDLAATSPDNYRAWFDLGYLYSATGRQAEAVAAYRKSVAAKPDLFESNLNLGLLLARDGSPEAATFLRAATRLTPTGNPDKSRAGAWRSLGEVLAKTDPQQAVSAFLEAAKLQPKDPEPHLSAGLVLEQQKQFDAAANEYRAAAALDPKSATALAGLANAYMKARHLPEAESALRQYLTLKPENAAARLQLGRVLAAQGKNDEAVAELQAGLKAAPEDAGAHRDLAVLYEENKQYSEAATQYHMLLQSAPNDPELHRALGAALLHAHQPVEAEAELLTAIKLKPDFGDAYSDLALAAADNRNYPLAIKALDERAKHLPENPGTYFLRATAYDNLHDYKQAAANYHQFLTASNGRFPEEEWKARHRLVAIEPKK